MRLLIFFGCLILSAFELAGGPAARQIVERPKKRAPSTGVWQGFLFREYCYACTPEPDDQLQDFLLYARLPDGKQEKSIGFPGTQFAPNQFRIAHGQLWSVKRVQIAGWIYNLLHPFQFDDFSRGKLTTGPDPEDGYIDSMEQSYNALREIKHFEIYLRIGKHYDYLPISDNAARLFLLVEGPFAALREKKLPNSLTLDDFLNTKKYDRTWNFTSAKYQGVWGPNPRSIAKQWKNGWKEGKWSDGEVLEVAFKEAFHVYALDKDNYFVTETGKVYYSPPLTPGECGPRKVTAFWNDPKQPVAHVLTDVDGKTPHLSYAFGKTDKGDKEERRDRFYFKLQGPEPKLVHFSTADLKATQLQEPLKTLFEYAVLVQGK